MSQLTAELLRNLLCYNPATGVFTWRERQPGAFGSEREVRRFNARFAGKQAGRVQTNACGYQCIRLRVLSKDYLAHRLAWLYMTSEEPPRELDHINRDGTDNRWANLRNGVGINARNRSMPRNNTSGVTGVHWCVSKSKWQADCHFRKNGKKRSVYLGSFDNLEDAKRAISEFRMANGFSADHGKAYAKYA